MEPWVIERLRQERERRREQDRVPLYIQPPIPPFPPDEERDPSHDPPDSQRGYCIIEL